MQAAVALIAVSLNLFPDELYRRKGGKGRVKEGWYVYFIRVYPYEKIKLVFWRLFFVKNQGAFPFRILAGVV